jgi:hypothetical protein
MEAKRVFALRSASSERGYGLTGLITTYCVIQFKWQRRLAS